MTVAVIVLASVLALGTGLLMYRTMQGRIPFDVGFGRTVVRLEPRSIRLRARRAMVFEMLAAVRRGQYSDVRDRDEAEVIEEDGNLILARFRTDTGRGVTHSIEAVRLYPDEHRITYRHVLGPFPYAFEEFRLEEDETGTTVHHRGEYAIDLWWIGRLAARLYLTRNYERLIDEHLADLKKAAEARAARSKVYPMPPEEAREA